jgi:alpha-L-arabinofuranosidase
MLLFNVVPQPSTALASGPAISSFTPAGGNLGAAVRLTGSGFTGATAVSFNGSSASFAVTSDSAISTSVPNGATTGPIQVALSSGTVTSRHSFKVKPRLTGFSESNAPVGTNLTVWGSVFTGATGVTFNGTAAGFTVNSYTQITTSVPVDATSGRIMVTTPGGVATSSSSFTVTAAPVLIVDASQLLGPISKGLFSNHHRYIDAGTGVLDLTTASSNPTIVPVRSDIVTWAKQFGVTGLRFPGGSESAYYNWYDGIGPVLNRPRCSNLAGPPFACNSYGIMEHMAFVEALGPDAVKWTGITLARQIRAVDAANFVEFVDAPNDGSHPWAALRAAYGHPQPYHVHYWAIGNEVKADPAFYADVNQWLDGYINGVNVWDGAIAIRDAMKAVDPTVAVGTGWIPQGTDLYAALQARQTRFDFADIHGGLVGRGVTSFAQHYTGIDAATHIADRALVNQQLINSAQFPAVNGMQVVSWENDAAPTKALRYSLSHTLANAVSLTTLIADGIVFDSHAPFAALDTLPPTAGARAEDIQWSPSSPPDSSGNSYVNWYATAPSYTYELFAKDLGTESIATTLSNDPAVTVNTVTVKNLYATAALNGKGDALGLIVTNADYANSWPVLISLRAFNTALGTVEQAAGADVTTVNLQSAPYNVSIAPQPSVTVPQGGTFTYTFPAHSVTAIDFRRIRAPAVSDLTPASGPEAAGTSVIISGSSFTGAGAVMFGAKPATGYTVDSDTQITATSPAGTGAVDVTVTTAGGTSSTSWRDQFTYVAGALRPSTTWASVAPPFALFVSCTERGTRAG